MDHHLTKIKKGEMRLSLQNTLPKEVNSYCVAGSSAVSESGAGQNSATVRVVPQGGQCHRSM